MIDERWERIKDLLHQAMQLTSDRRAGFLQEMCCADEALRREVESLLAADAQVRSDFLQSRTRVNSLPTVLTAFEPDTTLVAGQLFEERFLLLRELGEGGMGQVWLADQLSPVRRHVALKLIRAGMFDGNAVRRFRAEREVLAIMDHPFIAKVFDAGATAQGQLYFAMEYVPGLAISDYCDSKRSTVAQRLELFIRVCEGVQHAHQKAIIHRDLKPANILVVDIDGVPTPRIIDFGLAKAAAPSATLPAQHTHFGQFVGTPGYMSPEQADPGNQDIDTRTDVYSLGVILYLLLTGLRPFEMERHVPQPLDIWLRKLREDDPPLLCTKLTSGARGVAAARSTDLKQLMQLLRGDLEWIVTKALSRARDRRYNSPAELAADLRRHLHHEPVIARPASSMYQLRKFVRRHRIAAGVAAIVTASALVAAVAGVFAVNRQHAAEYQQRQAEYQTRRALWAQSSLLTEVAASRLKDFDIAGAQRIILEVLTNPALPAGHSPAAINVFEESRAADSMLAVLSGHSDRVYSARYSPDGSRIVTASADHSARVWDATTGAQLMLLAGHDDRVYDGEYSPDGTRIVTSSHDGTARVWDARTGSSLLSLTGHRSRVDFADFKPDGRRIVTASWDHTARVWDASTGAQLEVLSGHDAEIYSAAYSPDGTRIVTASQDKTARIWNASNGALLRTLTGHGDYVACAAYSSDGSRIVTASADKTARLWDAQSGRQLAVLSGHRDVVYAASFSPDGRRVVTASWDRTARIWDAHSGSQLAVLSGHDATLASAVFSPDGSRIVTASQDRTARVWSARETARAQLGVLAGHRDVVRSAAYSPDGSRIVTASWDGTARIWNAQSYEPLRILSGHTGAVDAATFAPDGSRIVTASQDKTARIWNADSGAQLSTLPGHTDRVYDASYSPDGTQIVTASRDKSARIWDASSGTELAALKRHTDRVYVGAWAHDGVHVVTASRDRTAITWDARTGRPLVSLKGHDDEVSSAAYSPDNSRIVTASSDHTARIWDAQSGTPIAILVGHAGAVTTAAYSPDGRWIVTASEDGTARIWDATTADQLAVLGAQTGALFSAAYSPDGKRIVTASEDRTARIWDAQVRGNLATQIVWETAAETDPLPGTELARLGIPPDPRVKTGSTADAGLGEPDSLARAAEQREHAALAIADTPDRNALLLQAFGLYAAAAERARLLDWPDAAWKHWRHRRATLARVLAAQGLMGPVSDTYQAILAGRQPSDERPVGTGTIGGSGSRTQR